MRCRTEHRLAALVELDVEHEEQVARRQIARLRVAGGPGADHKATAHRVTLQLFDDPSDLIAVRSARLTPLVRSVNREMAPEVSVRARNAPAFVGPRIPELAAVLLEEADVRVAAQEPQVLDDDVLPGDLFGRKQGKALAKVDLVVDVERGERVHTGPVGLSRPFREDFAHEVEILFHVVV